MAIETFQVLRLVQGGMAAHAEPPGLARSLAGLAWSETVKLLVIRYTEFILSLVQPLGSWAATLAANFDDDVAHAARIDLAAWEKRSIVANVAAPVWSSATSMNGLAVWLPPDGRSFYSRRSARLCPLPAFLSRFLPPASSRSFLLRPPLVIAKLLHPSWPHGTHRIRPPPGDRRIWDQTAPITAG